MKLLKRFIIVLIISIALFVGALFFVKYYLEQNKDVVVEQLEKWYAEHFHGELLFNDVTVSAFENLPYVSLTISDVVLTDDLYDKHNVETLKIGELHLLMSVKELLQRKIEFKAFKIEDGEFNLITTKDGVSNSSVFKKRKSAFDVSVNQDIKIADNNIKITVKDFVVAIKNEQKHSNLGFKINHFKTKVSHSDSTYSAASEAILLMDAMSMNTKKGSFFKDVTLNGKFNTVFSKADSILTIPEFKLHANKQPFKVKADVTFKAKNTYNLVLESPSARLNEIKPMLTKKIQSKLGTLYFSKPIFLQTNLSGDLDSENPIVNVKFYTHKNTLTLNDSVRVKQLVLKGNYVNRLSKFENGGNYSNKDFALQLSECKGAYKGISFNAEKARVYGTAAVKAHLDFIVDAQGENQHLNTLLDNKNFLFKTGEFNLKTQFKGDYSGEAHLKQHLNSTLSLNKTNLLHKPLNITLGIDTLSLSLNAKDGILNTLKIPITKTNSYLEFSGNVANASALIFGKNEPVSSAITISSPKIVWEDFIEIFGAIKQKEKSKNQDVFYKVLAESYSKFRPNLSVDINHFEYDKIAVTNFVSNIYFKKVNHLLLDNTHFNYGQSEVGLKANFDIEGSEKAVFDLETKASNVNLESFLRDFDYFNIDALKQADKIGGNVSLHSNMKGAIDNETGLDDTSLLGNVSFEIDNLQMKNFKPIQNVGNKIFRKKRFEDIRFAPIVSQLHVKNKTLYIPQTEIQSTAFNLFAEGQVGYDNNTAMWVSVPINNLKSRDLQSIPDKEGYIASGKKVYVEVKDGEMGNLTYKFRIRNKKLYEQKGDVQEYKINKKSERGERRVFKQDIRETKKETRQSKRELRKQKRLQKRRERQHN